MSKAAQRAPPPIEGMASGSTGLIDDALSPLKLLCTLCVLSRVIVAGVRNEADAKMRARVAQGRQGGTSSCYLVDSKSSICLESAIGLSQRQLDMVGAKLGARSCAG